MKILLIEDDRSVSERIADQAETDGHVLEIASCLEDLFRVKEITTFDIVVLDLGFSGLDPFLYLRKLMDLAGDTEILLLSVNSGSELKARSLGFGTKNFVADPLDCRDVFRRISALARTAETPSPARPTAPPPDAQTSPVPAAAAAPVTVPPATTVPAPASDQGSRFSAQAWKADPQNRGRVLVIGSHKGGTGKSTTAMHVITGLLYEGLTVASIDLDTPQQTLTRYLEHRQVFLNEQAATLPMPRHQTLPFAEDRPKEVEETVQDLASSSDVLVIDTPGGYSAAARMVLSWADSVVTPINDSFLDLDLLAELDPETQDFLRPGHYAKLIVEARERRRGWTLDPMDWLVIRNRLSAIDARNKRMVSEALEVLGAHLDFRQGAGLSERVIYRELFLQGLTLLDLGEEAVGQSVKISHVAARQELRNLLAQLLPPARDDTHSRSVA